MAKRTEVKVVASDPRLTLVMEERTSPSKGYPPRLLKIRHPGTAVVAALFEDDFILVSQFRPIVGRRTLEFPGGRLEQGETGESAAQRELREETGLILQEAVYHGAFFASVGTSEEKFHVFSGTCQPKTDLAPQPISSFDDSDTEPEARLLRCTREELRSLIRTNVIEDAKTALAFLINESGQWHGASRS